MVKVPERQSTGGCPRRLMAQKRFQGFRRQLGAQTLSVSKKALALQKQYKKVVEFQFLMGLGNPLKQQLAAQGHKVAEYIPYGTHWKGYYQRRVEYLKKRKKVYYS